MQQTEAIQLWLLPDSKGNKYLLNNVDPRKCRISRFNTRKARDTEAIERLAKRMLANGFEPTRALWAYKADDGALEVFAGGTRLEAALRAGLSAIYVWVHDNYSWEDISRLADQDNEDDAYHIPVRPMDVWAEYARLRDDEGWTQKRIAEAKGVNESDVSARLQYHTLPDSIRSIVIAENSSNGLTETHLKAVFVKIRALEFLDGWAQIDDWRVDMLQKAAKQTPVKSSRALAKDWEAVKAAVENANAKVELIPDDDDDEYIVESGVIVTQKTNWRAVFCDMLIKHEARSSADIDRVFIELGKRQSLSKQRKQAHEQVRTDSERAMLEEQRKVEALLARWVNGDCLQSIQSLQDGSVRLLLTDPPYGIDFQSNRRVASAKADKIANDGVEATALFMSLLPLLHSKLANDAHLLVFTRWDVESAFRDVLQSFGYTVKGSLVWVKNNHTSGDLMGSFAPRHERILHAVKGSPAVSPRCDDVLMIDDKPQTEHPTEKPVNLLMRLIEVTTKPGDLVVDTFAGTAATLVAAQRLERDFWGCELEKQYWNVGMERLKGAA